jgi:hypothetical protein
MVEECEMSRKILGLGSPGFSLGPGRAIKKEQPETHGNEVKSHVAPYLSAETGESFFLGEDLYHQRNNSGQSRQAQRNPYDPPDDFHIGPPFRPLKP